MKRYMNKWVLLGLKAIIALVWLACLWSQTFAAPILSEAMAGLYSSQVAMRWPYLIMGILFLVCVKIAFAAVWRLLSLSGSGTVFTAKAMPCVNWVLGCAAIATALTVLVSLCFLISGWHDATMQAMDYYTIALVLGVAVLAEIGFMLLMVVMKGLMHLFQRRQLQVLCSDARMSSCSDMQERHPFAYESYDGFGLVDVRVVTGIV